MIWLGIGIYLLLSAAFAFWTMCDLNKYNRQHQQEMKEHENEPREKEQGQ